MRRPSDIRAGADTRGFTLPTQAAAQVAQDLAALAAVILFGVAIVLWCGLGS